MTTLVERVDTVHTPETLASALRPLPGLALLRSAGSDLPQSRFSLVAARPFLTLRAKGSHCELLRPGAPAESRFGNPWHLLDALLARYELLDEGSLPLPSGGAFGFWGYDLRRFVEPRLAGGPLDDLGLPDLQVGFHDSLVAFDHPAGEAWIVSTGLLPDGTRDPRRARLRADAWRRRLETPPAPAAPTRTPAPARRMPVGSTLSREDFCRGVERTQAYIRAGHIYQVNLAQRLSGRLAGGGWDHFLDLLAISPAPYAAYLDCGGFQLASASPELFLRLSGSTMVTRPIKGTRPRAADPAADARLTEELRTSEKERAELVMITDLLRNDLGRVCEYGSVQVPDLMRLEKYPQVQHLVSTVEGRLRPGVTHLAALAAAFPGGSITGAPKVRAMEIIDELEPVTRGPYTGCAGYLGFNRESQLSILIRTTVTRGRRAWYHAGAGIVADSDPAAEYEETLAKARQFLTALGQPDARPTLLLPERRA